jgi:hypothetical protein
MEDDILNKVTTTIEAEPHSGQSLLLFALVSTLNIEKTGHMYMLAKLKEFTPENRQLAYRLMEMMACGHIHDAAWEAAFARMEAAIKG